MHEKPSVPTTTIDRELAKTLCLLTITINSVMFYYLVTPEGLSLLVTFLRHGVAQPISLVGDTTTLRRHDDS